MSKLSTLICSLSTMAFLFPLTASAQSVQMLPPIQSGMAVPCTAGAIGKILTWDGTTAIQCQAGIIVDNAGRVGIGTTTPSEALDVAGSINASGSVKTNNLIRMNMNNVGGILSGQNPGSAGWPGRELVLTLADGAGNNNDGIWIGPNTSGAAGGLGWVRLHSNKVVMTGNNVTVGIGTMSAASKLDVNGGVKVCSSLET